MACIGLYWNCFYVLVGLTNMIQPDSRNISLGWFVSWEAKALLALPLGPDWFGESYLARLMQYRFWGPSCVSQRASASSRVKN